MPENREIAEINGGGYRALINLSEGANCICLENKALGVNILRQPDYSAGIDNPFLYGMPILFPVNRISGGKFRFENREYTFPINEPQTGCHLHGDLHTQPFAVTEKRSDGISCRYCRAAEREGFPHSYTVEISYLLSENGLEIKTDITNNSSLNMPLMLGFHTTFNIPFSKGSLRQKVHISAEVGEVMERDPETYLPTGRIITDGRIGRLLNAGNFEPLSEKISLHYRAAGRGGIALTDTESGIRITYKNDPKFGWRLFYNGNADKFICLEPQTCMVDCKNSGLPDSRTGFDFVKPNGTKTYTSLISAEKVFLKNE